MFSENVLRLCSLGIGQSRELMFHLLWQNVSEVHPFQIYK